MDNKTGNRWRQQKGRKKERLYTL